MSNIDDEAMDWLLREEAGGLDDADRRAFEDWQARDSRHRGAYLRARAIAGALAQAGQAVADQEAPMAGTARLRRPDRRRLLVGGGAAIAATVVGGTLAVRWTGLGGSLQTRRGEVRRFVLADSSVAQLNTDSRLDVRFAPGRRDVVLARGEAWFEVAKDASRPFIVQMDTVRVQAVGTAFSVRVDEAGVRVVVAEGAVDVWDDRHRSGLRRLAAGQSGFVGRAKAVVAVTANKEGDAERALAWRSGQIILADEALQTAAAEFNRYNDRPIVVGDAALAEERFTGIYALNDPERFARDVADLTGARVQIDQRAILISSGGGAG